MSEPLHPVELHGALVPREAPMVKRAGEIVTISIELSELLEAIGTAAHHGGIVVGALDAAKRVISCIEGIAEEIVADLEEEKPAEAIPTPVAKPKQTAKKRKAVRT